MRHFLTAALLFFATWASAETVTLTPKNHVAFRDVVTSSSVATVSAKLLELSTKLPAGETIYLVLDTPGGSIYAGQEFIQFVDALPQKVKTITNFAASMGFIFVQYFDERLILSNGTLMAHRATLGEEGEVPGRFFTRVKFWFKRVLGIERSVANRLNISHKRYSQIVADEWWMTGADAVSQNAADKTVKATCSPKLNGTHKELVRTFFGSIELTWSDCPLITYPLDVNLANIYIPYQYMDQASEIMAALMLPYTDKAEYVRRYITTGKFAEMLK